MLNLLFPLGLTVGLVVAARGLLNHEPEGLTVLALYFVLFGAVAWTRSRMAESGEEFPDDAPLVGFGVCDFLARSFIGNHVLIRHAEREYALYAHLVPGSLEVEPEDRVEQGQVIGRCGHSGHSSEPHLHFHLQDSADLFEGMGLPVAFSSVEVDGAAVPAAHLEAGQLVRNGWKQLKTERDLREGVLRSREKRPTRTAPPSHQGAPNGGPSPSSSASRDSHRKVGCGRARVVGRPPTSPDAPERWVGPAWVTRPGTPSPPRCLPPPR